MTQFFKYWLGSKGPFIYRSEFGEMPLRVQLIEGGEEKSVALNFPSGIAGSGGNIAGTISAADYSAHRAAHFNAFNIAGDLL